MPNPSITTDTGTLGFVLLEGAVEPLGEVVDDVSRPGVDGHAARKLGRKSEPFSVVSLLDVTNAAAAKTQVIAYLNQRGKVCTLVDDTLVSWANVLILEVRPFPVKRAIRIVGGLNVSNGGDGYLVRASWELRVLV